jgi:hypothetical protein
MIDYFNLPISYIKNKRCVENHMSIDLELKKTDNNHKSLYEYVFNPTDCPFAQETIPLWSVYYTSDKPFLKDSQRLIKKMAYANGIASANSTANANGIASANSTANANANGIDNTVAVSQIWKDIKSETSFEDKYHYIDWEQLKFLNNSSQFLQCMSVYNISSPIFSLSLPIFFMIFPFVLLKLQGIEITMSKYIDIVKIMFQKHQLGQIFMLESASTEKKAYIIVSLCFYLFQIYQNVMSCIRFYKNISKIHQQLFTIRDYIGNTIKRMNLLETQCKKLKTYKPFIDVMKEKREILTSIYNDFNSITEYELSLKKMGEIGMIMKYFYMLYKNTDLHNVLQYSFGFNGYIHNIQGLREMYTKGHVSAFKIGKRRKTSAAAASTGTGASHKIKFENAYFPSLVGKNPVKNTYNMKKPIIITGPNAAGKTTMIKTTIFNILCSQQTGFGFYDAAKFAPFDYIHCYINIPDTSGRDSLFQSEARRCKDIITIMKNAGKDASHFCVFDELYSGTNPYEAIASATAFLRYLNIYTNSSYMITTHFLDICNRMKNDKNVLNMKMKIDETSSGDFIYTYILENGISNIKGGIKVLRDLEYPEYIINETKKMIDTIVI